MSIISNSGFWCVSYTCCCRSLGCLVNSFLVTWNNDSGKSGCKYDHWNEQSFFSPSEFRACRWCGFCWRNIAFQFNDPFGTTLERPWVVLGTDLQVTPPKCQRYVPELDLDFDAPPCGGASWQWNPLLYLRPLEGQQVVVCGFSSNNLAVTSRLTLQPSWPCFSAEVSLPCEQRKGKPHASLRRTWGLSPGLQSMRLELFPAPPEMD